ncbi:MAG: O-antigen ligase family protein, partial [Chloroflexi bacterium]|nr:O-antigen ligase family protein [Chloroflexota bacterium]
MILNLMLMMAAARLLATRQMASRVFLSLWILSALGLLYLTSSRGGWLGTAAGLACLGMLAFRNFRSRWFSLWEWLRHRRALLSLLAVIALAGAAAVAYLLYRQAMQPTHGSLFGSRAEFWGPAWNAFLQSPLLGKGPYTFISLYLQANSVPPKLLFVYAHNIYLDVLSGSGILGLAAFLWLVVAITRALWGAIRTGGEAGVVAMGAL